MSNTAPFLHIAYANNDTGTLDFTTTGGIERTYTGFYTDEYATDSSDPTKYKWLTNAEFKNKVSTAAYAKSADGKEGFTNVYPNLNLLNGSSAKTKDGFFKNFDKVENGYGEVTMRGTDTYAAIDVSDGFSLHPRIYKPGDKYTISVDIMFTSWNFPTGTSIGELWFGQRYTSNNDGTINSYQTVCRIDLPTDPSQMMNQWIRVTQTSTIPPHPVPSVNTQTGFQTKFTGPSEGSFTIRVRKPKQEFGSIVTPYLPSIIEVKDSDYPQYIGFSNVTNPTTFKDYEWTLLESVPKKILNTHVAYAKSADGKEGFTTVYPNLNLLDGTKDFSGTWIKSSSWVTDGTYKGLIVKRKTKAWNGIYKSFTAPKDGTYTFSAYIKCSGNNANIYRYVDFWDINGKQKWAEANNTFMGKNFDWLRDSYTVTLKTGDTLHTRYEITGSGSDSILWTAGHKWEEGSVVTPYLPSIIEVKDSDYPQYVGVYGDDSTTASQVPAAYKWSSIPVPGPTPPVVDNLYILTMPTVKSINLTYGIGTLTTKPVIWLSAKPKLDVNQVLWYKSEITGTDNSVGVYYSNLIGGANLDDGDSPLDNTVVSIVLNNKIVNVPRDLALKLELLSQTLNKRDNELAQLIADTNDRISNIDLGSGQAGLNREILDRQNGDDSLGVRIDTVTGDVNDLKNNTQTKFTNIEKTIRWILSSGY